MAAYPNAMSAILPSTPVDTAPVDPAQHRRIASYDGVGASELPLRGIRSTLPDVICGRGGATLRHPGNQAYRRIVKLNKGLYTRCLEPEKLKISKSIIAAFREQNGRFLERDNNTSTWYDIGDIKAVKKTSKALKNQGDVSNSLRYKLQKNHDNKESERILLGMKELGITPADTAGALLEMWPRTDSSGTIRPHGASDEHLRSLKALSKLVTKARSSRRRMPNANRRFLNVFPWRMMLCLEIRL